MQLSKRARFRIAVLVSAVAIAFALLRIFGTEAYTPGAYGNWIRVYPPPLEIMLITLGVTALLVWMWGWYRRDRVQQAFAMLNDDERWELVQRVSARDYAHLELELLDDGEYAIPHLPVKRKRAQQE